MLRLLSALRIIGKARLLAVLAFWGLLYVIVRFLLLDVKILKRVLPKCCGKLYNFKEMNHDFLVDLLLNIGGAALVALHLLVIVLVANGGGYPY